MKRSYLIKFGILAIFVVAFIWFCHTNKEEFVDLKIDNPLILVPLSFLSVLFLLTNGLINKYLLLIFKVKLSFKEWFGLSAINTMGNYLFPFRGGTISNAYYLRKKHSFSYSLFLSVLSAIYVVVFWVVSFVGLISMVAVKLLHGYFSPLVFVFFFAVLILLTIIIFISPTLPLTSNNFVNELILVINSWSKISSERKTISLVVVITFVNIALITLMSYFEFLLLGIKIPIFKLVFLSVFSTFSLFLSITPAGLGIKEAFTTFSGYVVGISLPEVLAVGIIDRLVNFLISLILGIYYSRILLDRKNPRNT